MPIVRCPGEALATVMSTMQATARQEAAQHGRPLGALCDEKLFLDVVEQLCDAVTHLKGMC